MEKEDINIRYEHQNNSNYLVIEDSSEYEDYQYKMLKRNNPEHFLHFSMYSVNGRYGIYYDITSRQQLSKYYEYGKMTMEDVKSICVNISEMVRIAEDYMLDIMYEIPKDGNIGKVTITEDYISGKGTPRIEMRGIETPLIEAGA